MTTSTTKQAAGNIDLDLLAYDIADLIDRNDYPIDASSEHILAALPAFLAQVQKNAAVDND